MSSYIILEDVKREFHVGDITVEALRGVNITINNLTNDPHYIIYYFITFNLCVLHF